MCIFTKNAFLMCLWIVISMALGGQCMLTSPFRAKNTGIENSGILTQRNLEYCKQMEHGIIQSTRNSAINFRKSAFHLISSATSRSTPSDLERLNVCLDRSVLPRKLPVALVYSAIVATVLLATALLSSIPAALKASADLTTKSSTPAKGFFNIILQPFDKVLPEIEYQFRLFTGRIQFLIDQLLSRWRAQFPPVIEELPADDWSVATLSERMRLEGPFLKHRFKLQSPCEVIPLGLGQDVSLCGLDSADNVCQGSLYPISPRMQPGYFDVITSKKATPLEENNAFVRFVDSLAVGDEVAVKPGARGLVYRGSFSPVTDVTMIAAGPIDIIPIIQLIKELLGKAESSVETLNVVWVNEQQEDFFLFKELEQSYFKYHPKLEVSVLLIRDLFGHDLVQNNQIQETIPDFKIGTMAVLSGPDYFVQKLKTMLTYIGYPDDVIVDL